MKAQSPIITGWYAVKGVKDSLGLDYVDKTTKNGEIYYTTYFANFKHHEFGCGSRRASALTWDSIHSIKPPEAIDFRKMIVGVFEAIKLDAMRPL